MMLPALLLALAVSAAPLPGDSIYALPLPLTDLDDRPAPLLELRGHPVMVTMFYGSCPKACPLLISKMKRVEQGLPPAERAELRVVLVTLDPERDTPQVLRRLATGHGVDTQRWRFLRTGPDGVRDLAAVLGIKYHRLDDGGFWHASVITLLDGEGRPVAREEGLDLETEALRAALHRLDGRRP